jgi:hypothetical protein
MNIRLGLAVLAMVAASVHMLGCTGTGGGSDNNDISCGVGPVNGPNTPNGTVTFSSVAVGKSADLTLPFADSNPEASETLKDFTITGPDAADFEVLSTFPIAIAAGDQVSLQIRFTPSHAGSSTATLVLDTAEMGPSPVDLQGTATAPQ